MSDVNSGLTDIEELLLLSKDENDADLFEMAITDLADIDSTLKELEFRRMFSGKMDENGAYLDIQAGSGGTEAQEECRRWRRRQQQEEPQAAAALRGR